MESITYKCPNCDGGLEFSPKAQKFKCGYCLSEFTEEELKKLTPDSGIAGGVGEANDSGEAQSPEGEVPMGESEEEAQAELSMLLYHCPSCGAEIVTGKTTAATFCYYCHNPVVLTGKLAGKYRPDCVVPFEMDKKRAEGIFKQWISKKKYVPGDFYAPEQMELMEGIYYPYWLYDCQVEGRIEANANKLKVNRIGNIEYTETSQFQVERHGTMGVRNVTRNALKKADHRLSEGVLPFDMEKLRPFEAGYLSGFKAERRDIETGELQQAVQDEIRSYAVNELKNSITNYSSVSVKKHEERFISSEWKYAFLPVWVLTYKDGKNDKLYYFAMNGQSGKICGVLPVDYKRLAGLFATIFLPLLLLLLIGGYFI